jgi:hypothetical protein
VKISLRTLFLRPVDLPWPKRYKKIHNEIRIHVHDEHRVNFRNFIVMGDEYAEM